MKRATILILMLALSCLTACSSIGPGTVARDRMGYLEAISSSWKQMMLLNIVKLRYGDAPVFLEVASVINQYVLETEISASASKNAFLADDSWTVGGKGRYADRPTITYNPLLGHKFTESLLKPIPVDSLVSLIQAGYSAELLFRVCVTAINGIFNQSNQRLMIRKGDPEFLLLGKSMSRVQEAGGMGMRIVKRDEKVHSVMFFRREMSEELAVDVTKVKQLLGLEPEVDEYRLVYGSVASDKMEIAILTRSMLQITAELSALVDVPESHIQENRASPGVFDTILSEEEERGRVKIKASPDKPDDAFVSVRYRDHWFYIDDRDFRSKRLFSFLMFIFTLVDSGPPGKAPALTLSTG